MADLKDDASKTLSAAARRSFFRRRLKHKRNGSKDGKDLLALDAISTDSLPIAEGEERSDAARGCVLALPKRLSEGETFFQIPTPEESTCYSAFCSIYWLKMREIPLLTTAAVLLWCIFIEKLRQI